MRFPGRPTFCIAAGKRVAEECGSGSGGGPRSARMMYIRRSIPPTWSRGRGGLGRDYQEMVDYWDRLGMVVDRGPPGQPFFIEDERAHSRTDP